MSYDNKSNNPNEACDAQQAFFLSEAEERRATMDPLDLLIMLEDAEDDMTMEYLLAQFTKH